LSGKSFSRRGLLHVASAAAAAIAIPRVARAAFPERPVHLMVGFAAGGTVDTIARLLGQAMSPLLGQQVVVENRPGASG
jgi:tripartite-type tricarboxylate transporter receptor subunit TctC